MNTVFNIKNQLIIVFSTILMLTIAETAISQVTNVDYRRHNVYAGFGGSGLFISGNYDFRFQKNRDNGLGLSLGIGGGAIDLFGESSLFCIPVELNYIFGNKAISPEIGFGLTYTYITNEIDFNFIVDIYDKEKESVLVSYIPIGFRVKPKTNGLLFRLNIGPLINYGGPNLWSDNKVDFYFGLSLGYSFKTH